MLDLSRLSARERLVAEQAVLLQRELDRVADHALHGQGFAALEAAVTDIGFSFLRQRLSESISARTEAQKKGVASEAVRAAAMPSSKPATGAAS